jgi:hypothetical protein
MVMRGRSSPGLHRSTNRHAGSFERTSSNRLARPTLRHSAHTRAKRPERPRSRMLARLRKSAGPTPGWVMAKMAQSDWAPSSITRRPADDELIGVGMSASDQVVLGTSPSAWGRSAKFADVRFPRRGRMHGVDERIPHDLGAQRNDLVGGPLRGRGPAHRTSALSDGLGPSLATRIDVLS